MIPTIVVVPVRDAIEHTRAFLGCMREQAVDSILVLDNGSKRPTRELIAAHGDRFVERVDARGLGIYEMWNLGFGLASAGGAANVLMSNNDVLLPDGGVEALSTALRAVDGVWATYPDYDWPWARGYVPRGIRYTEGVLGDGGLFGACFMLRGEAIPWEPLVSDPAYEWWFGDNHLARQIREEGGRQARVVGLPVAHVNEGTARHHRELAGMKQRDRSRWIESERRRAPDRRAPRKHVPGTRVWRPGGAGRNDA